jgi:hypothetical protein
MTVAELIAELQKLPPDAVAWYGGYYGEEITTVDYYKDSNEAELY